MDKEEDDFAIEEEDEDYEAIEGDDEGSDFDDRDAVDTGEDEVHLTESMEGQIIDVHEALVQMATQIKTTSNVLTKYEKTRVLGIRIKQLQLGASPLIDSKPYNSEKQIALAELEQKKLPFIIRRYICRRPPKYEDWRVCDLMPSKISELERREQRRMSNRESAKRTRERRAAHERLLEQQVNSLTIENELLQERLDTALIEIDHLRKNQAPQELKRHVLAKCKRQYMCHTPGHGSTTLKSPVLSTANSCNVERPPESYMSASPVNLINCLNAAVPSPGLLVDVPALYTDIAQEAFALGWQTQLLSPGSAENPSALRPR